MSEAKQTPKRKRRLFSFSLRSLLVVVTIFCVVLGYWTPQANRQRAVVKWVRSNGGLAYYDFEIDEKGGLIENAKPPGPVWVQSLLGNDYLAGVIIVELHRSELKDIEPLTKLKQLEGLRLVNTQVSNLTPLAKLTSLTYLNLRGTPVSDLTPLKGLTSLEWLFLDNTQVSDLTPIAGLANLENLILTCTEVSDLTPLAKLTSLTYLKLDNTQVTQEQINELQNALPNCIISWTPPDNPTEGN